MISNIRITAEMRHGLQSSTNHEKPRQKRNDMLSVALVM